MPEDDRPKFIPKRYYVFKVNIFYSFLFSTIELIYINFIRFTSIRSIPAYENAMTECFERCMDLYLCPRVRKKRVSGYPYQRTNLLFLLRMF